MLDTSAAGERIGNIAEQEGLQLEDGVIDTLIRCGDGDLRRAITYLQSAARLVGATKPPAAKDADDDAEMTDVGSKSSVITFRSIEEIAGVLPDNILDSLVEAMQPKSGGSVYEAVSGVITDLVADGWSATQLVGQVCPSSLCIFNTSC
jgi:replication factor C subunit 2/4